MDFTGDSAVMVCCIATISAIDKPVMVKYNGAKGGKGYFIAMDYNGFKMAVDPEGGQDPVRSFNSCFFGGSFMQLSAGSIWNCQVAAHHATLDAAFGWKLASGPADELPLASVT